MNNVKSQLGGDFDTFDQSDLKTGSYPMVIPSININGKKRKRLLFCFVLPPEAKRL